MDANTTWLIDRNADTLLLSKLKTPTPLPTPKLTTPFPVRPDTPRPREEVHPHSFTHSRVINCSTNTDTTPTDSRKDWRAVQKALNKKNRHCSFCNRRGHYHPTCPNLHCAHCGKTALGHIETDCPILVAARTSLASSSRLNPGNRTPGCPPPYHQGRPPFHHTLLDLENPQLTHQDLINIEDDAYGDYYCEGAGHNLDT